MTGHDSIRELLSLAAAGLLTVEEERQLENHLAGCEDCARQLAIWRLLAAEAARAEAPAIPAGLAARTHQRLAAVEGARQERRWSDAILAFLVLFTWTVGALTWFVVRLIAGGPSAIANATLEGSLLWIGGSTLLAWLTAGVAAAVLTFRPRIARYL